MTYEGKAYRIKTGFLHEEGTTAADVVRYEQGLGSNISLTHSAMEELEERSSRDIARVARTVDEALRFTEDIQDVSEEVSGGIIICQTPSYVLVLKRLTEGQIEDTLNDLAGKVVSVVLEAGVYAAIQGTLEIRRGDALSLPLWYRVAIAGTGIECADVDFRSYHVSGITGGDIIFVGQRREKVR